MNTLGKIAFYGLAASAGLFISGCALEPFEADFVKPANKVVDVSKVNVLSLKVKTNMRGNAVGSKKMNEALIRQMLSSSLCQSGYYRVSDDFWGGEGAPEKIAKVLANANEAGHPYASYSSGGSGPTGKVCPQCGTVCPEHRHLPADTSMKVKAELELDVDLAVDIVEADEVQTVNLTTQTYQIVPPKKQGDLPKAKPESSKVTVVRKPVRTYRAMAKGRVTARFNGVNGAKCPVKYENTFELARSDAKKPLEACLVAPSQLKVLADVFAPAVEQIVADLAPHVGKEKLMPAKGGAGAVVTLLYAQAFDEAIAYVGELARTRAAAAPDYVNLGHALAAKGRFTDALKAYKNAARLDPEGMLGKDGIALVEKMLADEKKVAAAGPGNVDTKFKTVK